MVLSLLGVRGVACIVEDTDTAANHKAKANLERIDLL